jgi:RNA polymerase-binding transcription factor DksA
LIPKESRNQTSKKLSTITRSKHKGKNFHNKLEMKWLKEDTFDRLLTAIELSELINQDLITEHTTHPTKTHKTLESRDFGECKRCSNPTSGLRIRVKSSRICLKPVIWETEECGGAGQLVRRRVNGERTLEGRSS